MRKLTVAIIIFALFIILLLYLADCTGDRPANLENVSVHRPYKTIAHNTQNQPTPSQEPFPPSPTRPSVGSLYNRCSASDAISDRDPSFQMTHAEAEIVIQAFNEAAKSRLNYEASIAKVQRLSTDEYDVYIPAYKSKGAQIESHMFDQLRNSLGDVRAAEIWKELRKKIEIQQAYWGRSDQMIYFEMSPGAPTVGYTHRYNASSDGMTVWKESDGELLTNENWDIYEAYKAKITELSKRGR